MMMVELPDTPSIYYWMYTQGLRHTPLVDIEFACRVAGKDIRPKDYENYWNGWYRSTLYTCGDKGEDMWTLSRKRHEPKLSFFDTPYDAYEDNPLVGLPEIRNRYVACNAQNKPLWAWKNECKTLVDAKCMTRCVYLAENLKGTNLIVFDCDGDHDPEHLDGESIAFFSRYRDMTHCLSKKKSICEYEGYERTGMREPASYHLTFTTGKIIPTRHFLKAHVDLLGNQKNQLRYFKTKEWNGLQPAPMTPEIWEDIKRYLKKREEA